MISILIILGLSDIESTESNFFLFWIQYYYLHFKYPPTLYNLMVEGHYITLHCIQCHDSLYMNKKTDRQMHFTVVLTQYSVINNNLVKYISCRQQTIQVHSNNPTTKYWLFPNMDHINKWKIRFSNWSVCGDDSKSRWRVEIWSWSWSEHSVTFLHNLSFSLCSFVTYTLLHQSKAMVCLNTHAYYAWSP